MSALALGACTDKGDSGVEAPLAPATVLGSDLPSAMLSIWGESATDVWAVGADNGAGAALVHYDGAAWTWFPVAGSGDLWWVRGVGSSIYAVGGGGRVLKGDATGVFTETILDPTLTLYGIWGASEDDIWAVGGNPDVAANAGAIWHYDGFTWEEAEVPTEIAASIAIFKVWGRNPTDVWVVGSGGISGHWDGTAWTAEPGLAEGSLFTVAGDATSLYAVGGFGSGVILAHDGTSWVAETPDLAPQLNGVAVGPDGNAVAVGNIGSWYRRDAQGWTADPRPAATPQDYHATWVDPDGGVWAVGGHLAGRPLDQGVIVYDGFVLVPEVIP